MEKIPRHPPALTPEVNPRATQKFQPLDIFGRHIVNPRICGYILECLTTGEDVNYTNDCLLIIINIFDQTFSLNQQKTSAKTQNGAMAHIQ